MPVVQEERRRSPVVSRRFLADRHGSRSRRRDRHIGGGGLAGPNAYLRGQRDLVFFGSMNSKFVFSVYAHPSIANMAGVRGKRVGVTPFGGTMDFATRHFFRQNGFDPGREVTMVQVGQSSGHLVGANRRIVGCGHHGVSLRYQGEEGGFPNSPIYPRAAPDMPRRRSRAASVSRSEQGASRGFRARNHQAMTSLERSAKRE